MLRELAPVYLLRQASPDDWKKVSYCAAKRHESSLISGSVGALFATTQLMMNAWQKKNDSLNNFL